MKERYEENLRASDEKIIELRHLLSVAAAGQADIVDNVGFIASSSNTSCY